MITAGTSDGNWKALDQEVKSPRNGIEGRQFWVFTRDSAAYQWETRRHLAEPFLICKVGITLRTLRNSCKDVFVPCTAHSEPYYNLPHLLLVKPTFANPEKTFTLPTLSHPVTALTVIRFFRILVPARGSARESSCCSRSGVDAEDLSLSRHVCAQTGQRGLFSGSWFAFWISSLNQASLAGPLPSAYPSPALSRSLSTLLSLSLLFHCWPAIGVKLDRSFSHS